MGIGVLSKKLPVSVVRRHQVAFVRALLFVLKDLSPEVSATTVDQASQTLSLVLQVCNSPNVPALQVSPHNPLQFLIAC